jgi:hypothetical protein
LHQCQVTLTLSPEAIREGSALPVLELASCAMETITSGTHHSYHCHSHQLYGHLCHQNLPWVPEHGHFTQGMVVEHWIEVAWVCSRRGPGTLFSFLCPQNVGYGQIPCMNARPLLPRTTLIGQSESTVTVLSASSCSALRVS